MPKTEIDYSNTIIYKIFCKDPLIKDLYVGHTTNFVQRKHAHKQCCNNPKSCNYDCKLYNKIRENGGWNNWKMEIINFFNCRDHYEARQKEQEYFISLNASLNSIEPLPKPKEKITQCIVVSNKSTNVFECKICDYKCNKKQHIKQHYQTDKHKNNVESNVDNVENSEDNTTSNICVCGKKYKDRTGLWKHKKKCVSKNIIIPQIDNMESTNNDLITYLMNENKELKNMIVEICKNNNLAKINS
jgi:hypothetical protein